MKVGEGVMVWSAFMISEYIFLEGKLEDSLLSTHKPIIEQKLGCVLGR